MKKNYITSIINPAIIGKGVSCNPVREAKHETPAPAPAPTTQLVRCPACKGLSTVPLDGKVSYCCCKKSPPQGSRMLPYERKYNR